MGGRRKFTLEEVKQVFASNGCEYLDDFYINHSHKHNYRCACGRLDSIQFKHLKRGVRCTYCGHMKTGKKRRNSLEKVVNKTASYDCVFLSEKYKTSKHVYNFLCNCGNKFECSYDDFLRGQRCSLCGKRKRDLAIRYSLDEVIQIFAENNCVYLSAEYRDSKDKYDFLCECGEKGFISLSSFIQGQRCGNCANHGFNYKLPSYLYLIHRPNQYKIGIYNQGSSRLKIHSQSGWTLLEEKYYELGKDAYNKEQEILDMLDKNGIPRGDTAFRECFDGYTEAWNSVDLEVSSFIELYVKLSI